jgi:hypothetical protein
MKPMVSPSVDDFVKGESAGRLVRINAQIPADLRKRVKAGCATEGVSMTDVIIELLEQRFPRM